MQATETVLSVIRATARNDRWRARYGETRSAGSGRGRWKRTRTAGTSPAAHFTRWGRALVGVPDQFQALGVKRCAASGGFVHDDRAELTLDHRPFP
jgi:hypothetical protein